MVLVHQRVVYQRPQLPLRPIFPGFIINTLFYAAIWFALFAACGLARKRIRKNRGRCPECKYDLRGALEQGCPECGWNRSECSEPAPNQSAVENSEAAVG